jgi:hypothetical protein
MVEVITANVGLVAALVLISAAAGALIAAALLPGPKRVRQLEQEVERLHKEYDEYRGGVTEHFKQTAELVGEMTQTYKKVYDHLADGAQTLCGEYDALTSSVFGGQRIIHDPTVAVGEPIVANAADVADTSSDDESADKHTTLNEQAVDEESTGEMDSNDTQPSELAAKAASELSGKGDQAFAMGDSEETPEMRKSDGATTG